MNIFDYNSLDVEDKLKASVEPEPVDYSSLDIGVQLTSIGSFSVPNTKIATDNLRLTIGDDAGKAAKAPDIAMQIGVRSDLVRRNFERSSNERDLKQSSELLQKNPITTKFLEDPDTARIVSAKNVNDLTTMEQLYRSFSYGQATTRLGQAGTQLRRTRSPAAQRELGQIRNEMRTLGVLDDGFLSSASEVIGQMYEVTSDEDLPLKIGAGFGLGAIHGAIGGPLAPATSFAGGILGAGAAIGSHFVQSSFEIEAGHSYLDLIKKGVDHDLAAPISIAVGSVNALLEVVGSAAVVSPLSGLAKKALKKGVRDALTSPSVVKRLVSAGRIYTGAIAAETATEVMQEVVANVGEQYAEVGEVFSKEAWNEYKEVAEKTAKAMVILAIPGIGVNIVADTKNANQARTEQEARKKAHELLMKSALLKASLGTTAEHHVELLKEKGIKKIGIDAKAFNEFFQSNLEADPDLATTLGVDQKELREQVSLGGEIKLSLEGYANLFNLSNYMDIDDHVRLRFEDMTAEEAKAIPGDILDALEKAAKEIDVEVLSEQDSASNITEEVEQQLLLVGQSIDVAAPVSVILGEAYQQRAVGREGVTAYDLFKQDQLTFEESQDEGLARASIQFPEEGLGAGPVRIMLSSASDKTSLLHELGGHLFMEQMKQDAPINKRFSDAWTTVQTWQVSRSKSIKKEAIDIADKAGNSEESARIKGLSDKQIKEAVRSGEDDFIAKATHEQWARGVEHYFSTGEAPSVKLREIFDRFKVWFTNTYSKMRGLDVKLSPATKAVMDRLIASGEDIDFAKDQYNLRPFFRTAEEAGMTKSQFSEYLKQYETSHEQAVTKQNKKYEDDLQREQKDWWQRESKVVRKNTIEPQVFDLPVYKALYGMAVAEKPDGSPLKVNLGKMDWDSTKKIMGWEDNDRSLLPKVRDQEVVVDGEFGSHPDVLAGAYGFASGKEMIEVLIPTLPIEGEIQKRTDEHMKGLHGSMEEVETRTNEGVESVHNDRQGGLLISEVNAFELLNKITPTQMRQMARERISLRELNDIKPSEFLNAEKRNGKEAARMLREGKRLEAMEAKLRQALNYFMALEAFKVRDEIKSKRKYLNAINEKGRKFKTIDADYVDKMKRITEAYDFNPRLSEKKRQALSVEQYNKWILLVQERDGAVIQPHPIIAKADGLTHYRDLTMDEFRALHDHVKNIEEQGRIVKTGSRLAEKVHIDELEANIVRELDALPNLSRQERKGANEVGPIWIRAKDRVAQTLASFNASLRKVEFILEYIDGKKLGPAWQGFYKPFVDAENLKTTLNDRVTKKILEAKDNIPSEIQERFQELTFVPELDQSFTRAQLIAMALNIGNQSSFDKMVKGSESNHLPNAKPYTYGGVLAATANLTKEEWNFVQTVWDSFEQMYPDVEQVYRHEHGVSPKKVEARKFVTVHGQQMEGGYLPVMYARDRSLFGVRINDKSSIEAMQNRQNQDSVFSGMTKERTTFSAPVSLELSMLSQHVDNTTHYIAYYDAVRLTRKLLTRGNLASAIINRVGPEQYSVLERWISDLTSNGNTNTPTDFINEHVLRPMRNNTTIATLGLSMSTMLMQPLGVVNSVDALSRTAGKYNPGQGSLLLGEAYMEYLGGRSKVVNAVLDDSLEMARRLKGLDQDVNVALKSIEGKKGVLRGFQRFTLMGITMMQFYSVDVPTWIAAKNKAISEGMTYDDAVYSADSVVRMSQGSAEIKDLSQFQRNPYFFPFTMFYSYFNVLWNILAQSGQNIKSVKDAPQFAARMLILLGIPAFLESLMRQKEPPEDMDYISWMALQSGGYAVSSIPVMRSFVGATEGFGFSLTPMDNYGKTIYEAITTMSKALDEGELDMGDAMDIYAGAGHVMGLPVSQVKRTIKASIELTGGADIGFRDFAFGIPREDN